MATMPIESETRPPIISRASTSRPSSSVPRMCAPENGGANRFMMSI